MGATDGEDCNVGRQRQTRRPRLRGVRFTACPVDGHSSIRQPLELLLQENDGTRADQIKIDHIAGEQQCVGTLGKRRFKNLRSRLKRRFQKQVAQMLGHFRDPAERAF